MIIVLRPEAEQRDSDEILSLIEKAGLKPLYMPGVERVVIGAIGDERILKKFHIESHPMVEKVEEILSPYKLVSRDMKKTDTVVPFGKDGIGGNRFIVIAGPCAVESAAQMKKAGAAVKAAGAAGIRGGAYKPRSSPYSFQGMGLDGLKILKDVSLETGLPVVTEIMDQVEAEEAMPYVDAFQVGARNMQNFRLLTELGQLNKTVILKRGMSATITELLLAAEYILNEGNPNVVLCERGIRTFETSTRNTLDLSAVPNIKKHSHLPVIVDPSHGTGVRDYVAPMAFAAAACGADGIMIEVHPCPQEAESDGQQSLNLTQFEDFMKKLKPFALAAGKTM